MTASNTDSSPEPKPDLDGATVRFPPPLVPLIALGLGIATQSLIHSWRLPLPLTLRLGLGGLLVIAGLGLIAAALGRFRRTGQDPKPWLSTPEIISMGVYRFTRNPMYLSMGLLQGGLGVLLANAWVVLLVPVTWTTIGLIAIRHEEAYLEAKFGAAYVDYKASVRRWL